MGELIGYARSSTVLQDLTAQREILVGLGVPADQIYLDKGLTGTLYRVRRATTGRQSRQPGRRDPLVAVHRATADA